MCVCVFYSTEISTEFPLNLKIPSYQVVTHSLISNPHLVFIFLSENVI